MSRVEEFKPYLTKIKELGYRVIVPKDEANRVYCFIADELGRVGECCLNDFGFGVNFSTIHKPCLYGTAFRVNEKPLFEISKEDVEQSLLFAPSWARGYEYRKIGEEVRKWTIESFLEDNYNKAHLIEL